MDLVDHKEQQKMLLSGTDKVENEDTRQSPSCVPERSSACFSPQ